MADLDEDEIKDRAHGLMASKVAFDFASAVAIATGEMEAERDEAVRQRKEDRETHHPRARGRRDRTVLL